jgi:hypothetical protein
MYQEQTEQDRGPENEIRDEASLYNTQVSILS